MKWLFCIVVAAFVSELNAFGQSVTEKSYSFPKSVGWVNDFEGILTVDQEAQLSSLIQDFTQTTTNQIAIVTVDSIAPYENMRDFARDLGNQWGVGQKGKDNGLVIVFSKRLRSVFIATGLGTENILTDAICQQVIDQRILPACKQGNYYQGLRLGLLELITRWR